jgi:hypothetical protein
MIWHSCLWEQGIQPYMREELSHGFQEVYYGGRLEQYSGGYGKANIEFEAKLFKGLTDSVKGHKVMLLS